MVVVVSAARFMSLRNKIARAMEPLAEKLDDGEVKTSINGSIEDLKTSTTSDAIAATAASHMVTLYDTEVKRLPQTHLVKRLVKELQEGVVPVKEVAAATGDGEPGLFVVNPGDELAGRDSGSWVTPNENYSDLKKQMEEAVGGKDQNWEIQQYRNFPDMGKQPDLRDVALAAEALAAYELWALDAAMKVAGDISDAIALLESGYGLYGDAADFARTYVQAAGGVPELDEGTRVAYLDAAGIVKEATMEKGVVTLANGKVYVFE